MCGSGTTSTRNLGLLDWVWPTNAIQQTKGTGVKGKTKHKVKNLFNIKGSSSLKVTKNGSLYSLNLVEIESFKFGGFCIGKVLINRNNECLVIVDNYGETRQPWNKTVRGSIGKMYLLR